MQNDLTIYPFIISILGIVLFTFLLIKKHIGQTSYCFLIAIVILMGLVLNGFDRLEVLDLKNLRMTLREIKETKKEIFAKTEDLKRTAYLMSQIMAYSNAAQGRLGSKEGYKIQSEWYSDRL
ncbi:hypothetical protein ACFL57_04710, partial [Candidatus Margulisiibacteriota bacterium]